MVSLRLEPSTVNGPGFIGKGGDLITVGHENQGASLVPGKVEHQPHDEVCVVIIQVARRLISEEDSWGIEQGTADGNSLHLAPAQSIDTLAGAVEEANPLQQGPEPVLDCGEPSTGDQCGKGNVVMDAQVRKQVEELKYQAHGVPSQQASISLGEPAEVASLNMHLASRWEVDPRSQVEQSRFPASAPADD